jgi:hypothetical protein
MKSLNWGIVSGSLKRNEMEYNKELILKEITPEIRSEMIKSLMNNDEFRSMRMIPMVQDLWCAGCWLNGKLEENGFKKEDIDEIGFEHGRMCFGRDPYEMAARQYDKYINRSNVDNLEGNSLQYNEG